MVDFNRGSLLRIEGEEPPLPVEVGMWGSKFIGSVLVLVVVAFAQPQSKHLQQGRIVSVKQPETNGVPYRKPTDAPMRSSVFTHEISVQVDNTVLVGRYESATDYLPGNWVAGNVVEVSSDKHRMHLRGPSFENYELSIVGRHPAVAK